MLALRIQIFDVRKTPLIADRTQNFDARRPTWSPKGSRWSILLGVGEACVSVTVGFFLQKCSEWRSRAELFSDENLRCSAMHIVEMFNVSTDCE